MATNNQLSAEKAGTRFVRHGVSWEELDVTPSIKELLHHMANREYCPKIKYIVLFGSVAREEATPESDIDIAVISDAPLTRTELNQVHPSVSHCHLYDLDYRLVNVSAHKLNTERFLDVGYHIRNDGIIVYSSR